MVQIATFIAYLVAAGLFVVGIRRLREAETARSGNTLAGLGMIIALVATLFVGEFTPDLINALGIGVGVLLALFTVIIGAISFMGSIVAVSKLQEFLLSGSVTFPGQQVLNVVILLVILALSANALAGGAIAELVGLSDFLTPFISILILLVTSLILGFLFVIPIGGADIPVVISLLNAFTGLAAAASGFVLSNYALII